MSIFHRKFSTGEIVAATGVPNDTIQNWIKRDQVIGQHEGGGLQGRQRQFSLFNLMEIAIAKALIDAGLTDMKAVTFAAMSFAHSGQGALPGAPARIPSLPFHVANSKTLLIASPGHAREYLLKADDHPLQLPAAIFEFGTGAVVINASHVFEVTMRRAGLDPVKVMREGYGD